MKIFEGRNIIVATKHNKEKVISPILSKQLGLICIENKIFDTDILGTFSGEIERKLSPVETIREKCLQAMLANKLKLGIASEATFGPHPSLFFVPANDELLIFIDLENNVEILHREISSDTNFNAKEVKNEEELLEFAIQIGFPSHGLILRKSKEEFNPIFKGINEWENLKEIFHELLRKYGVVYAETDMRAMYNPKRMKVIEIATEKLVQKIKSTCPGCQMPGFTVTQVNKGLVCRECNCPTNSTLSYLYTCGHCGFSKEELYPHNKTQEDPMYCDYCNP